MEQRGYDAEWHLHSIMYLLIPSIEELKQYAQGDLHSIMYLLIRFMDDKTVNKVLYLHSIMYLLILSYFVIQ